MNQCRRCGKVIPERKLWCVECKGIVDDELQGGKVRPLEEYFRYYLKHKGDKKDEKSRQEATDTK